MAYPTFPTLGIGSYGPVTTGSSRSSRMAVLTATFGDRYSQRTGDGINPLTRDFNYRSVPLAADKIEALEAFLVSRKGYLPFLFQVPYEPAPRQFICDTWTTDYSDRLQSTLTATFKENFDP
ncbi:phage tail protein [Methylobacterium nodulans]|uniref:Minor tail family protein n=1 Tax=Methylobacterium nodulans (strain LMG 21967 / CNCM I-2342 / ORS 2060) TaxID=460265 RepID=B8IIM0_METNO|nr:phage tail protein [Methylobacterium nodulans]ACL59897.1 minor tail family protein [Methylobacterium nodulans ORS 2060]